MIVPTTSSYKEVTSTAPFRVYTEMALELIAIATGIGMGLSLGRRSRQVAYEEAQDEVERSTRHDKLVWVNTSGTGGSDLLQEVPETIMTVMLIGDSGSGKTLFCRRITDPDALGSGTLQKSVEPSWHSVYVTLQAESPPRQIRQRLIVQMLDTPGRDSFTSLIVPFYRSIQACILVFDAGSTASFQALQHRWYSAVQQHRLSAGSRVAAGSNVVLAYILDEGRERQVKRREAALWCSTVGLAYFETHANDKYEWKKMISHLAAAIAPVQSAAVSSGASRAADGDSSVSAAVR